MVSYPGKETVNLLRPYLKDRTVTGSTRNMKNGVSQDPLIHVYGISDATYLALHLLGEKPKRPKTYVAAVHPFLFEVGFEAGYFPKGSWKSWPQKRYGGYIYP